MRRHAFGFRVGDSVCDEDDFTNTTAAISGQDVFIHREPPIVAVGPPHWPALA